jgi:hypothetical protein
MWLRAITSASTRPACVNLETACECSETTGWISLGAGQVVRPARTSHPCEHSPNANPPTFPGPHQSYFPPGPQQSTRQLTGRTASGTGRPPWGGLSGPTRRAEESCRRSRPIDARTTLAISASPNIAQSSRVISGTAGWRFISDRSLATVSEGDDDPGDFRGDAAGSLPSSPPVDTAGLQTVVTAISPTEATVAGSCPRTALDRAEHLQDLETTSWPRATG